MAGIEGLKEVVSGVFGVVKFGVKVLKNIPKLKEEATDLDIAEGTQLIVQIAVEEVPELLAELKK